MPVNLDEIEARWADIIEPEDTDAPWTVYEHGTWGYRYNVLDAHNDIRADAQEPEVAVALAAARTDIPALVDEVKRLREVARDYSFCTQPRMVYSLCDGSTRFHCASEAQCKALDGKA